MPRRKTTSTPAYCLHRASGKAVVRIDGKDFYLGQYGTPQSHEQYDKLCAEWLAGCRRLPQEIKQPDGPR